MPEIPYRPEGKEVLECGCPNDSRGGHSISVAGPIPIIRCPRIGNGEADLRIEGKLIARIIGIEVPLPPELTVLQTAPRARDIHERVQHLTTMVTARSDDLIVLKILDILSVIDAWAEDIEARMPHPLDSRLIGESHGR